MKNFIFKSSTDFHKILFNKLDMILTEQRHQRQDLVVILGMVNKLINSTNLQKQVDEYFNEEDKRADPLGSALPLEDNMKDIPEE